MKKLLLLLLLGFVSRGTIAQNSIIKAPRDSTGAILYGGLGLPYVWQPSVTVTSYNVSERQAIPAQSGSDTGRQFRNIAIFNPDPTQMVFVCAGNSTGCSRDMWFAPPGVGFAGDFGYFGVANNITYLYFRVDGGAGLVPTISIW